MPNRNPKRKRRGTNANDLRDRPPVKRRRQRTGIDPTLPLYAEMLANPCNSSLVPGIFGDAEGLLARVKSTITNSAPAASTCGFILWSPDYHEKGSNATVTSTDRVNMNVLAWSSDSPDQVVENSQIFGAGARKMGTSTVPFSNSGLFGVTARAFDDPAAELLTSDIVQDARTIGACIKMTYTGTALKSSGQFARVQDLPLSAIFGQGTIGADEGPSTGLTVNDLFRITTNTGRLGVETLENVSRPDDSSHIFRGGEEGPLSVINDAVAFPDANASETKEAATLEPQWFGFCWRGLDTSEVSPLVFELFKSIEWRPRPNSGFTLANKRSIHTESQIKKVTKILDEQNPSWRDGRPPWSGRPTPYSGQPIADLDQMIRDKHGGQIPLTRAERSARNARHALGIGYNAASMANSQRDNIVRGLNVFTPGWSWK